MMFVALGLFSLDVVCGFWACFVGAFVVLLLAPGVLLLGFGQDRFGINSLCMQGSQLKPCGEAKARSRRTHPIQPILSLWMDTILHHSETMGYHCLLVFVGESSETRVS